MYKYMKLNDRNVKDCYQRCMLINILSSFNELLFSHQDCKKITTFHVQCFSVIKKYFVDLKAIFFDFSSYCYISYQNKKRFKFM